MGPRGCVTMLVVAALIGLGADWLVNHMPAVNPPPSPVHVQSLPLSSPVGAAPANPAAALTDVLAAGAAVKGGEPPDPGCVRPPQRGQTSGPSGGYAVSITRWSTPEGPGVPPSFP